MLVREGDGVVVECGLPGCIAALSGDSGTLVVLSLARCVVTVPSCPRVTGGGSRVCTGTEGAPVWWREW